MMFIWRDEGRAHTTLHVYIVYSLTSLSSWQMATICPFRIKQNEDMLKINLLFN